MIERESTDKVLITIEDSAWISAKTESEWHLLFTKLFEKTIHESGFFINLLLTNDTQIREINKIHRNIDKPTNVLSFPHYFPEELNFVNPVRSSVSERSEQAYTPNIKPTPTPSVLSFLERKKENQITGVSVKEENEVILDRQTEVIWYNGVTPKRRDTETALLVNSLTTNTPDQYVHENMLLGDIVMSYNTVQNEASLFGKSFDARASHLFVHGLLHVLGYDHIFAKDRHKMEELEAEILESFGIQDPYVSEN
jgi:rRNA maturation RNase YbeY